MEKNNSINNIKRKLFMEDKVTLYIATHNKTGKKYFGKTTRYFSEQDLQKYYHGSGSYWLDHLNKHGDNVTMEIYGIYNLNEVEIEALNFSKTNNIVKDRKIWCNIKDENGLDGGSSKDMYIGKKLNYKKIKCPHCGKEGIISNMKRYHFDNCKKITGQKVLNKGKEILYETVHEGERFIGTEKETMEKFSMGRTFIENKSRDNNFISRSKKWKDTTVKRLGTRKEINDRNI